MSDDRNTLIKFKQRLDLISALRSPTGLSKKQIKKIMSYYAGKEEVNDRTVKREIDSLRLLYPTEFKVIEGQSLKKESENTIYRLEFCELPTDTLENKDLDAIDYAIKTIKSDKTYVKQLCALRDKLTAKLHHHLNRTNPGKADKIINDIEDKTNINFVHTGPIANIDIDPVVQETLAEATHKQFAVSFDYYKKPKDIVCPLGFLVGSNNKYLIAADIITDEKGLYTANLADSHIKKYKLPNISNVKNSHEFCFFRDKFSLEEYANSMFGVYNDGKKCDVEWYVPQIGPDGKKSPIEEIKRYTFHKDQDVIQNPEDGSLTIRFKAGDLAAISRYLFGWGGVIIPTKPKELVDTYKEMLNTCLGTIKKKK